MTANERLMLLQHPLVLPADVLVFPVVELAEHVRATLDCNDDDYAVTRPGLRSFSRIVDKATADLLEEFRIPTPVAEAIVRYSRRLHLDPEQLLEQVFPALITFSNALFLVPEDSPTTQGIAASYATGQVIAGYEVCRLVQTLEDTEVYQMLDVNRRPIALKITRPNATALTEKALQREAVILEHLNGICSPMLVELGTCQDKTFVASSWRPGVPISMPAWEYRLAATPSWRNELHALCCRLTDAYALLHEQGAIHGDIHPKNVLVDADNTVTLLDFGLSRLVENTADIDHNRRAGLAWFMEPEVAAKLLQGEEPPPASFAGDQYALAALVYYLICGTYHISGVPEVEALYTQVVEASPLPFSRQGFESWPDIEAVLHRALAKKPKDRFPSVRAFCDSLKQAQPPSPRAEAFLSQPESALAKPINTILERSVRDIRPFEEIFTKPPTVSIQFGAAGLAWFLYRAAQLRDDPQLIVAADHWSRQALLHLDDPQGFEIPSINAKNDQFREISLQHGRSGVHFVHALISHARGDLAATASEVEQFMAIAQTDKGDDEFSLGRSSLLVGAAMLYDVLRWSSRLDTDLLAQFLNEELDRGKENLEQLQTINGDHNIHHLGIAHGWAGILYAHLLAYRVLKRNPPTQLLSVLDRLAAQAVPHGRGVSWIGTVQHIGQERETPAHSPGWCSGSAGHVFLWTLAHELFGEDRYLALAEQAGWFAWEHADRHPRLCCGLTGRAFSLLHLYRYTGQVEWLSRAQQLARFAFSATNQSFSWDDRTLSLYWGALGPALLAFELEKPERAVMPAFELEGWPVPTTP